MAKLTGQREIEVEGVLRRLIQAIRTSNTELLRHHPDRDVIRMALADQNAAIKEAIDLGVIR